MWVKSRASLHCFQSFNTHIDFIFIYVTMLLFKRSVIWGHSNYIFMALIPSTSSNTESNCHLTNLVLFHTYFKASVPLYGYFNRSLFTQRKTLGKNVGTYHFGIKICGKLKRLFPMTFFLVFICTKFGDIFFCPDNVFNKNISETLWRIRYMNLFSIF